METETPIQPEIPQYPEPNHFAISKRTLGLIVLLAMVTIFFLILALAPQHPLTPKPVAIAPTPTPVAQSVLSLTQDPSSSATAQIYDVNLDSHTNAVDAVQIELGFDPTVISNISIKPGSFFPRPSVLTHDIDYKNGRISYAIGIQPTDYGVTAQGAVAVLSFVINPAATASSTQLDFLPKTSIAGQGINGSVLKSSEGITITLPTSATTH